MGQHDIIQFFKMKKNHGRWITSDVVQKHFGTSLTSTNRCLRKLMECGMVERVDRHRTNYTMYYYRSK